MRTSRVNTSYICALLLAVAMLAGCASNSGRTYSANQARVAQSVETGVVQNVAQVTIDQDSSVLGPLLGGVIGGVLGSTVGRGTGKTLAVLGGAAGGAAAGGLAEKGIRSQSALEIVVLLDNGQTVSVVQGDDEYFSPGDRVRVVYGAEGRARVMHQ